MSNKVKGKEEKKEPKSFWETLPGILTALAALVTAIGSCLTVIVALPRPNAFFPATIVPSVTLTSTQAISIETATASAVPSVTLTSTQATSVETDTASATEKIDPDLVIGLWNSTVVTGGQMEIRGNDSGDGYIAIQASNDSSTSYEGEVIFEFSFNPEKLQFEGRHLWGGGKEPPPFWGEDGGLVMELRDANTLFVRFLDSIYSDGWAYTRVK